MNIIAFFRGNVRRCIILGCLLFCTGCAGQAEETQETAGQKASIEIDEKALFTVFTEEDYARPMALYEEDRCYLGASTTQDPLIQGDIAAFETKIKQSHDLYGYTMRMGEAYPLQWILECYSASKIPVITLFPYDGYDVFNLEYAEETAEAFGILKIPVFVELFPNPQSYGQTPKDYIDFYKTVREIFQKKANNVAFIWSVGNGDPAESIPFYPGDKVVDWVGIHHFQYADQNIEALQKRLSYFYFTFQEKKPIMITKMGISHYSTKDHKYMITETAKAITDFYEILSNQYPAVKGVLYYDGSNIDDAPQNAERNDYTITAYGELARAYENAISIDFFTNQKPSKYLPYRCPFLGIVWKEAVYIDKRAGLSNANAEELLVNGKAYLKVDKEEIEVDKWKKTIYIRK